MGSDDESKCQKVPVLTHENHERWFYSMKMWLQSKGEWQAIEPAQMTPRTEATTSDTSSISSATVGLSNLTLDPTSPSFGQKTNGAATFRIVCKLNEDDQEMAREMSTAKAIWDALKRKYTQKLPTTSREDIKKFVFYTMIAGKTIDGAWADLQRYGSRIASADPAMAHFKTSKIRMQYLLASLPIEYATIRDAIDSQDDPDLDRCLQKLRDKEAQLKGGQKVAMYANKYGDKLKESRSGDGFDNRHSFDDRRSRPFDAECYICGGKHRIGSCRDEEFLDYIEWRKYRRSKGKSERRKKYTNGSKNDKHKGRAYNAKDKSSSSSSSASDSDSEVEEVCALSKEEVSNAPRDLWVADTSASSHMTDNLRLFNSPLQSIRRHTIKVGGGKLYSDQCGTAIMRAKDGNTATLSSVLFVPNLGVNLLSVRRLCEHGLVGGFSQKKLWLNNVNGKQALNAKARGGVYIVEELAINIDEHALMSTQTELGYPAGDKIDHDQTAITAATSDNDLQTYLLWHRRFAHLGEARLNKLHKITTMKKPIPTVKNKPVCEVCALTKLVNKRGHTVLERPKY